MELMYSCSHLVSLLSDFLWHQAPPSVGLSRQEYWRGLPCPPLGNLPNPGIKPRSPALQLDSIPSEPPGKPRNTVMGSLSLLQEIFPNQESNWGFLHYSWILYQLSYLGNPRSRCAFRINISALKLIVIGITQFCIECTQISSVTFLTLLFSHFD